MDIDQINNASAVLAACTKLTDEHYTGATCLMSLAVLGIFLIGVICGKFIWGDERD